MNNQKFSDISKKSYISNLSLVSSMLNSGNLERALLHFWLAQSIFSVWWNEICLNQFWPHRFCHINRTFLEVVSMVVSWWRMNFLLLFICYFDVLACFLTGLKSFQVRFVIYGEVDTLKSRHESLFQGYCLTFRLLVHVVYETLSCML